jgi:hypothetical protein
VGWRGLSLLLQGGIPAKGLRIPGGERSATPQQSGEARQEPGKPVVPERAGRGQQPEAAAVAAAGTRRGCRRGAAAAAAAAGARGGALSATCAAAARRFLPSRAPLRGCGAAVRLAEPGP